MTTWSRVKDAIAQSPDGILRDLGLKFKHISGEWNPCCCPLHNEDVPSASISPTGGLKCHVCHGQGEGRDIFQWVGERDGLKEHEVLDMLGQKLGIDTALHRIPPREKKRRKHKIEVDEEMVRIAGLELVQSRDDRARFFRTFLHKRGLTDIGAVAHQDVGFMDQQLCFFQRYHDGTLRDYFRVYDWDNTTEGKGRFAWAGNAESRKKDTGQTGGLWPLRDTCIVKKGEQVWIVEGEWDALIARCELQWQEAGIHVFSVNGGTGTKFIPKGFPADLAQNPISVCYDNDIFQGPKEADWKAPTNADMDRLRASHQQHVGKRLPGLADLMRKLGNEDPDVTVRAVPLAGDKHWKGDLRDWFNQGGRDPSDFQGWPLDSLRLDDRRVHEIHFSELVDHVSNRVRFNGTLDTLIEEGLVVHQISNLDCERGDRTCCLTCDAPRKFGDTDWQVTWTEDDQIVYSTIPAKDREKFIKDAILGRPTRCPTAQLKRVQHTSVSRWTIGPPREDAEMHSSDRMRRTEGVLVISDEIPFISGQMIVTGKVVEREGTIAVIADKIEASDRPESTLNEHLNDLTPLYAKYRCNSVDSIDKMLGALCLDLAANTTEVFDQDEMHIATLLPFFSGLWYQDPLSSGDRLIRGWLDAIMIGDTGAAKTPVLQALCKAIGGQYHSSPANVSRAGFVLGSQVDSYTRKYVLKPGILPRQHMRLLAVDEAQNFKSDVLDACQTARSDGHVESGKMGSDGTAFPCAVRLIWSMNWIDGRRHSQPYVCSHLSAWAKRKDEVVRRFDYAIRVDQEPNYKRIANPNEWSRDLLKCLAMRAWGQRPDDIVFEEGVGELAHSICKDWQGVYFEQDCPLYVGSEKDKSILRVAIAIANLCFSHPDGEFEKVMVRRYHVEWAAAWLERTYASCEYDRFSEASFKMERVSCPYYAEYHLTRAFAHTGNSNRRFLEHGDIESTLSFMLSEFTSEDVRLSFGNREDADHWLAVARSLNVTTKSYSKTSRATCMKLSGEARTVVQRLIELDYVPNMTYRHRQSMLSAWIAAKSSGASEPPNMPSLLDYEEHQSFDYPDSETNIGEAESLG